MDCVNFYNQDGSILSMPAHYTKNGKTPQQITAKDGSALVVNSTNGKPIGEHQMKALENQHIQIMGKIKTAERLRAKLAERQTAKATAKK